MMIRILLFLTGIIWLSSPVLADDKVVITFDTAFEQFGLDGKPNMFGKGIGKVKAYLEDAGVDFDIKPYPIKRALRSLETSDNHVFVGLMRTPDREDKYHWLKKISTSDYHLITRKSDGMPALTRPEIVAGNYTAVCEDISMQCKMLLEYGFPEKRILRINGRESEKFEELVFHGRIDFMIGIPHAVSEDLAKAGLDAKALHAGETVKTVDIYAVASATSFNPALLARLTKICN